MVNTLETRSHEVIGPYVTDMKLLITKIGSSGEGNVHRLCAPILSDFKNLEDDYQEISLVPNEIRLSPGKVYMLSTFVSPVEYRILPMV